MKKIFILLLIVLVALISLFYIFGRILLNQFRNTNNISEIKNNTEIIVSPVPTNILDTIPTAAPTPNMPNKKVLNSTYHIFQTFNNCGPASLSMTYNFYGLNISQQELGNKLRPYQVVNGDNDDKSVTLEELAQDAESRGFIALYRPNGNIELLKQFIYYDIPIITRTWKKVDDNVGHYRVVKGYDDTIQSLIQDDSLQGKNLNYSYDDFNAIWQKFNYEYLVLIPKEKESEARNILGKNYDVNTAWKNAVNSLENYTQQHPTDYQAKFNLSVAYYKVNNYRESVAMYEESKNSISFRSLWYQIEPIKSYYELKQYDRALALIDTILNNGNMAYSEAYIIKGDIFRALDNIKNAKDSYEKAVFYNKNLQEAKDRLTNL